MTATILGRETASIPSENPYHPDTLVKHYDIPIVPRIPLQVGQRVKIWSLNPRPHPPAYTVEEYRPPHYVAQDSGVVGEVVRVRSTTSATTEFVIQNESPTSPVLYACVAIQHIQGQTVLLSRWERLMRAVFAPPLPERCIPLELDATVEWKTTSLAQGQRPATPCYDGAPGQCAGEADDGMQQERIAAAAHPE